MSSRTLQIEQRSLEGILEAQGFTQQALPPASPAVLLELIRTVAPVVETFPSMSIYLSRALETDAGVKARLGRKTYEFPRLAAQTLYEFPLIAEGTDGVTVVLSNDPLSISSSRIATLAQAAPALRVFARNGLEYLRATLHPTYDELTGLPNRSSFSNDFQYALRNAEDGIIHGTSSGIGLIFLDVDNFKNYNDALGHLAGDKALARMGAYLHEAVRESDVCGRYGGEEFIVGALDATKDEVVLAAERIRHAIETRSLEDVATGALPRAITATLGVAHTTEIDPGIALPDVEKALITLADARLYRAKHGHDGLGKGKISARYKPSVNTAQ